MNETQEFRILTALTKGKLLCDDCLTKECRISKRQRTNDICNLLYKKHMIDRREGECSICIKTKLINYSKNGKRNQETKIYIHNPSTNEGVDIASTEKNENTYPLNVDATTKEQFVALRIGQEIFRKKLIEYWGGKCSLTKIKMKSILRASHIKPWSDSTNSERLDVYNGLLLTPNADSLFDQGLISFTDNGNLMISKRISNEIVETLLGSLDFSIELHRCHLVYMQYHREKVYY